MSYHDTIEKLFFLAFIVTIILILSYKWSQCPLRNTKEFKVNEDPIKYYVQDNFKDADKAAKMMSLINTNILKLLKHLKQKKETGQFDDNPYVKGVVNRILTNWNPEVLFESPPSVEGTTSYTIAKGEKTVFCLRDKVNERLHQLDDMLFVALHELSHMGDLKWGHNKSFWEIFKFVLIQAKESGIYEPIDYVKNPVVYCGLTVNYNPYFDDSVKNI